MPFVLNRYSAGDTTYISKHNSDATLLEAAINGLQTATSIGLGGNAGTNATFNDIWDRNGLIGASAFLVTCATSLTLSVTSGSVWMFAAGLRGRATADVTLNFAGKTSGVYAIIADTSGNLSISALSASVTGSSLQIYSVQYNAPDFGSAARLVDILLHGDDYNRMLSSPTFGSFTRVADRLSAMEGALGLDAYYAHSGFQSGTTWSFKAGQIRDNNLIVSTTTSTLPLTASATHYIEVAISDGSVSYTTGGFTASEAIPLRTISTVASAVTGNHDARTWAIAAGGGGGTAGLANSGTTDGIWYLYRATGATSSPVSTAAFAVDRGSLADVAMRWNESTDTWEYTNDGTNYIPFGQLTGAAVASDTGTTFNLVASAPGVLVANPVSTTTSTVIISLSAYVSTNTTAVFLRGTAFDSAASVLTSAEPFTGVAFYRDSAAALTVTADVARIVAQTNSAAPGVPQTVIVPVSDQKIEYAAWGASNDSLQCSVYLVAYLTPGAIATALTNPMTSAGDIIYGATSGTPTRLSAGTNGYALILSGGLPTWLPVSAAAGTSGMANPFTASGDMVYATGTSTATRLAIGTASQVLTISGGVPVWSTLATGMANPFTASGDTLYATGTSTATGLAIGTSGQVYVASGGVPAWWSTASLAIRRIIQSAADAASITPTVQIRDWMVIQSNTQAAGTLTISVPTGAAYDGQWMTMRLYVSSAQTPSFHSHYRSSTDLALPSVFSAGLEHRLGFEFNARVSVWDYVAQTFGF